MKTGAKITESSGNLRLTFHIKILTGPNAGDTVFHGLSINQSNETSVRIFFSELKNLGIDLGNFPDGTEPSFIADTALGRRIQFDYEHVADKKSDKIYGNLKKVKRIDVAPLGPSAVAPSAPADTKLPW